MDKLAQIKIAVALSQYFRNPTVPAMTKKAVAQLAKQAGIFDGIGDTFSGIGSSVMDAGSSLMGGISDFGTSLSNSLGSMISLPVGVTAQSAIDKVKNMDPEISGLIGTLTSQGVSTGEIWDAIASAIQSAGATVKDVLG